jgi:hypothetical protein
MTMKIRDAGGVLQTITGAKIRDGATLRQLRAIKLWDGTIMRTVAQFVDPLTVTASPSNLSTFGFDATITSASVSAVPAGGLAPYTYVWSRTSGAATINTPTIAATTFTETGMAADEFRTNTFTCTVSDSSGQTAVLTGFLATFTRISFS